MINVQKYILPSNGFLGYEKEVTIRSMKGKEISTAYSSLTDASLDKIIEAVIEPKIDIDILADEDKVFILHMTRTLTFGNEIKQSLRCPFCGEIHTYDINYKDLQTKLLEDELQAHGELELETGDIIKKRVPISEHFTEIKQYKDKYSIPEEDSYALLQVARIEYIQTKVKKLTSIFDKMEYIVNIPGKYFIEISKFVETDFGFNTVFQVNCNKCNTVFQGGIGITADFFR